MKRIKQAACTFSLLAAACGPGMEEQDFEPTEPKSAQEIGQIAQLLRKPNAVPDQYIVVFKEHLKEVAQVGAQGLAQEMALSKGGKVMHVYKHAVNGFSVRMSEARMRELLADPRVAYIEEDGIRTIRGTQTGATWGLDRIDQREPAAQQHLHLRPRRHRRARLHHRHGHPADAHRSSPGAWATATTRSPRAATPTTATATARTWRARSAAPPTAWPRR